MQSYLLSDILVQIENDRQWRDQDLVFFENQLANELDETKQKIISKALILLLYSVFEGHVKLIFQCYVNAINQLELSCNEVIIPLLASGLNKPFEEFKNASRKPLKNKIFKKEHPKDFLELGRRIEFLENLESMMTLTVKLETDKIVDTESNLTKKVLSKILFRIGFDVETLDENKINNIEKLLEFRNAIAHGSRKQGWTYSEYSIIRSEIYEVMQIIKQNVISHFSERKFMKASSQLSTENLNYQKLNYTQMNNLILDLNYTPSNQYFANKYRKII